MTNSAVKRRLYERLDARIDGLLYKAIAQAGFSSSLADHGELWWRLVDFRPGLDLVTKYTPPDYLRSKPRYHVRIHWRDGDGGPVNVHGPVAIVAGRYCGLKVFVTDGGVSGEYRPMDAQQLSTTMPISYPRFPTDRTSRSIRASC